ncbi:MAG: GNAT family N-acetyltransferase [Desulfovibrio sp.]|jgi:ribosomal protein S18 acetylase RimI-like enzyme|nr:GNAT family N-acetyltransferase [Desulfovibrio sp.]
MNAVLTPLPWDSAHLGLPCARLDWEAPAQARPDDALPNERLPDELLTATVAALRDAARTALVVGKLPAGLCEPSAMQAALPGWRVRMLGVEVVHHRPAGASGVRGVRGVHDTRSGRGDRDDVTFYAGTADPTPFLPLAWDMLYSRYHLDPEISTTRAAALWEASITDHCRGFAQETAVGTLGGRPAGMATLHLDPETVRLHIVGVLAWARGQGVGRRLLEAVIARHGHQRALLVEAHAENRAAAALYGAVGCRPLRRYDVLHFRNLTFTM